MIVLLTFGTVEFDVLKVPLSAGQGSGVGEAATLEKIEVLTDMKSKGVRGESRRVESSCRQGLKLLR